MLISTENQPLERVSPPTGPFNLDNEPAYKNWRETKLAQFPADLANSAVQIADLANPSDGEVRAITALCRAANMAIYQCTGPVPDDKGLSPALVSFAAAFGLREPERHRSAKDEGIVALQVSDKPAQRGFIPYTDRPLNWHTDGYYNPPHAPIRSFILHCVRQAQEGGLNQLLDPEIAYIRLRDENRAFITALAHPEAMIIPENVEANGTVREASIGPVFSIDGANGALAMRYTARTRNITWRDDATTRAGVDYLNHILNTGDPLMFRHRLEPGQGLICNNVLHNRTAFVDAGQDGGNRLLYRLRYREAISGRAPA